MIIFNEQISNRIEFLYLFNSLSQFTGQLDKFDDSIVQTFGSLFARLFVISDLFVKLKKILLTKNVPIFSRTSRFFGSFTFPIDFNDEFEEKKSFISLIESDIICSTFSRFYKIKFELNQRNLMNKENSTKFFLRPINLKPIEVVPTISFSFDQ